MKKIKLKKSTKRSLLFIVANAMLAVLFFALSLEHISKINIVLILLFLALYSWRKIYILLLFYLRTRIEKTKYPSALKFGLHLAVGIFISLVATFINVVLLDALNSRTVSDKKIPLTSQGGKLMTATLNSYLVELRDGNYTAAYTKRSKIINKISLARFETFGNQVNPILQGFVLIKPESIVKRYEGLILANNTSATSGHVRGYCYDLKGIAQYSDGRPAIFYAAIRPGDDEPFVIIDAAIFSADSKTQFVSCIDYSI